jgi:hypothetical protein
LDQIANLLRLVSAFGKEYTHREKKAELDAHFDEAASMRQGIFGGQNRRFLNPANSLGPYIANMQIPEILTGV